MKPLKNWLWKYPKIDGKCPEGCDVKVIAQSACDRLAKCQHGFWQINCMPIRITHQCMSSTCNCIATGQIYSKELYCYECGNRDNWHSSMCSRFPK